MTGSVPAMVQPATNDDLLTIVDWLARPEIARWLDFGAGRAVTTTALKYGIARGMDRIFTFAADEDGPPIGVVALSQIHQPFRTAMLWYALGKPAMGGQGLTTRAVRAVLEIAFKRLELDAINAWAVAENRPSVRILEKTGFRLIGRQRRCHYIDDQPFDRLLFDRLATRFEEPDD